MNSFFEVKRRKVIAFRNYSQLIDKRHMVIEHLELYGVFDVLRIEVNLGHAGILYLLCALSVKKSIFIKDNLSGKGIYGRS